MLYDLLDANRAHLIERCRSMVARRASAQAASVSIEHGIPLFLGQLIETLRSEHAATPAGPPEHAESSKAASKSRRDTGATQHGMDLFREGYTMEQVVRDYGDLCQAVTDLAIQKDSEVSPTEFRTLNRCLDDAIAKAVTEFARGRDQDQSDSCSRQVSERLGLLAHELRNFLNTAILSFAAIKSGSVAANGATSAVLDRSLLGLRDLIDRALADVRLTSGMPQALDTVQVDRFIAEVQVAGCLEAKARGCDLIVAPVNATLVVYADRQLLYSAVSNLLQNAFKFTHAHSQVRLTAYRNGDRVLIEVEDRCGGLAADKEEDLFATFTQFDQDRSGLGLGLSIARRAVEGSNGTVGVRNLPGVGCVFTVDLPLAKAAAC